MTPVLFSTIASLTFTLSQCYHGGVQSQFAQNEWLHLSATENRQDVMTKLLQNGADINGRAPDGSTVLHKAAGRGDLSAVKFFLANGIDKELQDKDGLTALHLAVINGQHEVATELVAVGADLNARSPNGSTLLHSAVAGDLKESVEFILGFDNVFLSLKNNDMFTPLTLAEKLGRMEIVPLLKEKIGNISCAVLLDATYNNDLVKVRSLVLRGADLNCQDKDGWTPLYGAASNNDMKMVQFMVERGAETNTRVVLWYDGHTVLHFAARYGTLELVKYLVENGADISLRDFKGQTPLAIAEEYNRTEIVNYLQSKGGAI